MNNINNNQDVTKDADGQYRLNDGLDDNILYWLCCGSIELPHSSEYCNEAKTGHPERVRFGTAKDHSEWQKSLSSNDKLRGE